ncbi:MAG: TCP-1/cpn60 chaperonin family protein, partial [Candidatus Odinarchaeota archaeon]
AVEIEIAKRLRDYAGTVGGREQLAIQAFADAVEIIPVTLAENGGYDPMDILVELRAKHEDKTRGHSYGVNLDTGKPSDMHKAGVIEPYIVKKQIIKAASEAAVMILRIDDVIAAKTTEKPTGMPEGGPGGGAGMGGMPGMM